MGGGVTKHAPTHAGHDPAIANLSHDAVDNIPGVLAHQSSHQFRPTTLGVPFLVKYPFVDFRLDQVVGKGRFSSCYQATSLKDTTLKVAIKEMHVGEMSRSQLADFKYELNLLSSLRHRHLARVASVFDPSSQKQLWYVVMEYLRGGELLPAICRERQYMESDAVRFIQQLASAVQYLHGRGVVHGFLIPENLVLTTSSFESALRIVDFGQAQCEAMPHNYSQPNYQFLDEFRLPEFYVERRVTPAMDIWCVGIISHIILAGSIPFETGKHDLHQQYSFEDARWSSVSDQAKNFLCRLLKQDPKDRPSADEMMKHPWINFDTGGTSPVKDSSWNSPSRDFTSTPPPAEANRRGSAVLEQVKEEDDENEEEDPVTHESAHQRKPTTKSAKSLGVNTTAAVTGNTSNGKRSRASSTDLEDLDDEIEFVHYDLTSNLPLIRFFHQSRQNIQPMVVASNTVNFVKVGRYSRERVLAFVGGREDFGEFLQTSCHSHKD